MPSSKTIPFTLFTLLILLNLSPHQSHAQTKVNLPPPRIDLSKLTKKDLKANSKQFKQLDQTKKKRIKQIRKTLNQHSSLDKQALHDYLQSIQDLDTTELKHFQDRLSAVTSTTYDTTTLNPYRTIQTNKKAHYQSYKDQITKSVKDPLDAIRTLNPKDTTRIPSQWLPYNPDTLTSYHQNQLPALVPSHLDTTYLQYADTTYLKNLHSTHQQYIDTTYLEQINSTYSQRLDTSHLKTLYDTLATDYQALADTMQLDSTLVNQERVAQFLKNYMNQRIAAQDLNLPEQSLPSTEVKNFIPSLEDFSYEKPQIPTDKLSEAVIEQKLAREKEELAQSILKKKESLQGDEIEEKKQSGLEGWKLGGFIQVNNTLNALELSPTLAYGIGEKLDIGIGYSTVIPIRDTPAMDRQTGYRFFTDYIFYRNFFLHAEWALLQQKPTEGPTLNENNLYLGLGRIIHYKRFSVSIMGLYNLSAPNQIEARTFSMRLQFNYAF